MSIELPFRLQFRSHNKLDFEFYANEFETGTAKQDLNQSGWIISKSVHEVCVIKKFLLSYGSRVELPFESNQIFAIKDDDDKFLFCFCLQTNIVKNTISKDEVIIRSHISLEIIILEA